MHGWDEGVGMGGVGVGMHGCVGVSSGHTALPTTWGLGMEGFRHWLQVMHCTYLLTKSEYFMQGQESKSEVQ